SLAPGAAFDRGRDYHVSLDSYRLPQAGQPPVYKVLSRHSLLASLGAWSLENHLNKQATNSAPGKVQRRKKKTPALCFASWNVRTLCPGLTTDLQQVNDAWKTAVIDRECSRLNVDIACLQETQLADSGTIREANYTFFWQGKPSDEPRQHGVGFAVKNTVVAFIEPPSLDTERILALWLSTSSGTANILSVYAPTLCSNQEEKDQFYEALDQAILNIPSTEGLYLQGDFNARVGADNKAWPTCLGSHGRGKINETHQVSWRHPRSRHWHQLDLVITRRVELASVLLSRSYHSADCDTDHSLVASKVRIIPKKLLHAKKNGCPHINTCCTSNPEKTQQFICKLHEALTKETSDDTIDSKWSHLRNAVYNTAITAYGKKESKNTDWYEANWEEMKPVTEAKRKALLAYKAVSSPGTLQAPRTDRKNAQQTAHHCANTYWLNLIYVCIRIRMYEGIKKATGPPTSKLQRWVEHYLELYATQNVVTDTALDAIPDLPVMEELDTPPTLEELRKAIDCFACGKAPGSDGIPPEVLKIGKPALLKPLHKLLCLCWGQGHIPQDMPSFGKAFAHVALARWQTLASRIYPESQCGFRAGRSTVDMIFSLRQLQEKCCEQQMPLYIAFIDLTKAFDLLSRSGLFRLLQKVGCPPQLLAIIRSFHENMHSTVCFNGATSEAFPVSSGVKQGCVLAQTLFAIFFSMLLQYAFKDCSEGVYIHTRTDGKLFNIARLRAKTKVTEVLIRELLFADDAALTSHTEDGLQKLVCRLSHACKEFGLTIILKKTNVMVQDADSPPTITIEGYNLEVVENYTYLGSTISNSLSVDTDVNGRIAKASAVMARLNQRVWKNHNLTEKTKICVYQACVLSTLLYSSEAWTTYASQEVKLNSFHLRCLRRILRIQWQDKVPNTEVLERTGMNSMFSILSERRLCCLGHVRRMDPGCIPKDLLYGELAEGARLTGRPRLRYKDVCKKGHEDGQHQCKQLGELC
ncbi:uncharacterized protein LOC117871822, partial [Tachysurus ichikawai]